MAKQGGMGDRFYVGGDDIGGNIGSLQGLHGGPNPGDVTDITQSGYGRIGLLRDGGGSAAVWFDTASEHPVLKLLPTADVIFTYGVGAVLGNPAASCIAKQVNYDGSRAQDGSFPLSVSWQASAGTGLEWGEQLTAGRKTDTTATNGTGIDFGAVSTLFGASAYAHVFSVTGTSITLKVQDSADNVTFADVTGLTFSTVLAAAKSGERVATGVTATIRRYVRVISTGTFSNAQFMVNFTRFITAQ
jgi:hypothetical protein